VRAEIAEMDVLLDTVGEAQARLGSLEADVRDVERARGLADLIVRQLSAPGGRDAGGQRESVRRAKRVQAAAGELHTAVTALERRMTRDVAQLDQELGEIRGSVERLRLVPASSLFVGLERVARDVAQAQAKQVVFASNGGDVRLDAHVLAAAHGALQQIVRNAVVHGIEPESERRALGKPPAGAVTLEVVRRDRRVVVRCRDDGGGIDLAAVRLAAGRQGLVPGGGDALAPDDVMRMLLRGGISTSAAVTELSGRGIGFDVVRDAAARLGGEVTIASEPGKGTTIELEAPLSLSSVEALRVEAGERRALVPLSAISQTRRILPDDLHASAQGEALSHDDELIPFLRLSELIGESAAPQRGPCSVLIAAGPSGLAAIGVDRILGSSRAVVRAVPGAAAVSAIVAGVSLDRDGNPELVLDPDGIVAEAQRERSRPVEDEGERLPILVVDDSLTTRMLEQSILESAGYLVEVASSGEEAMAKAMEQRYLLFLVDVEMPGMDGFTFIEQTRADPELREIPAILVTSRSAPDDLRRGFAAGASAYVTKGEFDQGQLLERIRALVMPA
jgi:two-component system chemotaxis sensor kinase CheA